LSGEEKMFSNTNRANTQRTGNKPVTACVRTEGAEQAVANHKNIMDWCGIQEPRNPAKSALKI
jgi:hypothetical protein